MDSVRACVWRHNGVVVMVILPSIRRKYMVGRIPKGSTVPMSECVVTLSSDSVSYTGSARTVGVTVTWDGATLVVNTDYTLSWANNTDVGPATVTVTGMGQFSGSVTKTFYVTSSSGADWEFSLSDIPQELTWVKLSDSTFLMNVCPSNDIPTKNNKNLRVILATGTGYYLRSGTWQDFDPSTYVQTGITSQGGFGTTTCHTPDGLHYLFSTGSQGADIRTASTEYDVTTIPTQSSGVSLGNLYISGGCLAPDGMKVIFSKNYGSGYYLQSYDLSTAWDLTSRSEAKSKTLDYCGRIFMNIHNGKQLLMACGTVYPRKLALITLREAWDASSVDSIDEVEVPDIASGRGFGCVVNPSGTKMVIFRDDGYAAGVNLS